MKILITGHSAGIGKELFNYLTTIKYTVKGMSKTNGYNIANTEETLKQILDYDPDVFFNNAYFPKAQIYLLKELHKLWAGRDKVIINTGSISGYYQQYPHKDYATEKRQIKEYCISASLNYPHANKCRIHNISFGFVNTDLVPSREKKFISAYSAAKLLADLIAPQEYLIPEMVVANLNHNPDDVTKALNSASTVMKKKIAKSVKN